MKALSLTILCIAVAAANASWHGGVAVVAPAAHGALAGVTHGQAVISGPAGTVATHGNGAWGGHGGWGGWGGAWNGGWNGGWGAGALGAGAWAGSGHEGQWVPDGTEHLYDDGSYRPEHHYGGGHGVHGGHW